jgi:hypothetical protein
LVSATKGRGFAGVRPEPPVVPAGCWPDPDPDPDVVAVDPGVVVEVGGGASVVVVWSAVSSRSSLPPEHPEATTAMPVATARQAPSHLRRRCAEVLLSELISPSLPPPQGLVVLSRGWYGSTRRPVKR